MNSTWAIYSLSLWSLPKGGSSPVGPFSIADLGLPAVPARWWVRFRLPGGSDSDCRQQALLYCHSAAPCDPTNPVRRLDRRRRHNHTRIE
jgi:hypothetical protein